MAGATTAVPVATSDEVTTQRQSHPFDLDELFMDVLVHTAGTFNGSVTTNLLTLAPNTVPGPATLLIFAPALVGVRRRTETMRYRDANVAKADHGG